MQADLLACPERSTARGRETPLILRNAPGIKFSEIPSRVIGENPIWPEFAAPFAGRQRVKSCHGAKNENPHLIFERSNEDLIGGDEADQNESPFLGIRKFEEFERPDSRRLSPDCRSLQAFHLLDTEGYRLETHGLGRIGSGAALGLIAGVDLRPGLCEVPAGDHLVAFVI